MISALIHSFLSSSCKNQRQYQKAQPATHYLCNNSSFFQRLCLLGFALVFLHMPLPRLLFYIKFHQMFFWFFNCERKMSITTKKCVSVNLSLTGCFGPIDSTSCTNPGSSMLSSTLTDVSMLPPRGLSCLSDNFSIF